MLRFLGAAALAATLSFGPVAGVGNGSTPLQPIRAVASVPAQQPVAPAAAPRFGLASLRDSGLAPGQSATDFQSWLRRAPGNVTRLISFQDYLDAEGVGAVIPLWQLTRTSSSWRECGAEPFEAPPADKWQHIVTTLKFVRDDLVPRVGQVEALSAFRNDKLNACSNGAEHSAHREFFAIDLTPVNAAVDRSAMISSVCAAHAHDGRAYNAGLGFYTGRRFHVDSSSFRKWGANGKGATSPCVTEA
jgi:hypothetical protein